MKKIIICLSLMLPNIAVSCPTLEGTWTSSIEKFKSFNKKWANLDARAWAFMSQTQGHELIEFNSKKEMRISTPEIQVKMGEKAITMPAKEELINYSVLGCNDTSIVLQFDRYGKTQISQFHFENETTFWEYMGSAKSDGNSHIREYYIKK
ncbi:hypothetical protein AAEU29_08560 [Pseudoalteromonas sp. SSM20]|uniref:hypothetical protein n=1 Tax=Pseudoalteromonas sp. SSM20 TaxID=3139394 RepID=UPI003BAC76D4